MKLPTIAQTNFLIDTILEHRDRYLSESMGVTMPEDGYMDSLFSFFCEKLSTSGSHEMVEFSKKMMYLGFCDMCIQIKTAAEACGIPMSKPEGETIQ